MKTFTIFILSLLLSISSVSLAQDQQRDANNIKILSGQTIFGSGTSVVVIDLRDPRYYPVTEFDFRIQFSGITNTEGSYLSGQTLDAVQFTTTCHIPSGNVAEDFSGILTGNSVFTANLNWVTVSDNLNIQSGNTEHPIPLYAEKGRFLLIRIINGAHDILTDLWLDMD